MRIDAPEITGSLIVSGSISISGSLNLNGSNVSSGNGGTISGSTQISALGFVSASVTGSSLISASIAGNTITLNKGNGATLAITLPEGSTPTDISALNTFTASVSTSVGLLQSTASYLNTTFSASVDSRLNSAGGSTDISALNIFTASVNTSITSLNTFTASATESVVTATVTSPGGYYIIDGVNKPKLSFTPGVTYRFDVSAVSSHPFRFSTTSDGTHNGGVEYNTGVTSGTGFIQIQTGYNTANPLYYYCTAHSNMGNEINTLAIGTLSTTASFNSYTQSNEQRITSINTATGSLFTSTSLSLTTASISSNTLTFTKGNGAEFTISLPEGSVPTNISALNASSASMNLFTASANASITSLNTFTASIAGTNTFTASLAGTNTFTASVNTSITSLNTYTQSNEQRVSNINTATASLFTSTSLSITGAVFNGGTLTFTKGNGTQFGVVIPDISSSAGTISGSTQISGLGFINATQTSSMNVNSASYALTASYALNVGLSINTGSFAITGSNTFIGNQIVTGSLSLSGSLRGNVLEPVWQGTVYLVSSTHSMDFSKSNFFQLQTVDGNNHISASNWQPGQTVSLKIKRIQANMTASFAPAFKFSSGSAYTASVWNGEGEGVEDIITFITYDTNKIYASSVKNMI